MDVWEFFILPLVEVSKFNPLVHQKERHTLMFVFVVFHFLEEIRSPYLIHALSIRLSASNNHINDEKNNESPIEDKYKDKASPPNLVK